MTLHFFAAMVDHHHLESQSVGTDENALANPVGINRNGKPVAVVISATEYAQLAALKEAHLKQSIEEGIADLRAGNAPVSERIRGLRLDTEREFGAMTTAINRVAGPALLWSSKRDARRHPTGRTLEPRTFVERHA